MWVKRSTLGTTQFLWTNSSSTPYSTIGFDTSDVLYGNLRGTGGTNYFWTTNAVYRDPSGWYHIVAAWDTANATPANRFRLYVNGTEQTFSSISYCPQNTIQLAADTRLIGSEVSRYYFNGYLANIHFIDGQALTPASFAETDATTGQWIPKAFSGGSYGTNGFYLQFADNSSNTASTLGKDTSGLSNNWTPNNLSVTAGAGNDSLVDSPTNYGTDTGVGGTVRGNYATLNPLVNPGGSTFSNGNLDCVTATSGAGRVVGSIGVSSGKWYWEIVKTGGSAGQLVGIAPSSEFTSTDPGGTANSYGYYTTGQKFNNATLSSYGSSWTTGDVIGVALDLDAGTIVFYKNNTSQGTAFSGLSGNFVAAISDDTGSGSTNFSINFGQRAFAYTAPSGFKALCTTNLPAPLVTKSNTVMDVALYTGNGSTQSISSLNFSPDFLWFKSRSSTNDHVLFDAVRGRAAGMRSNGTDAEYTSSAGNDLASFDSAGFTVGAPQNWSSPNGNGLSVVAWAWDAGTSTVSNNTGSISSQVRANATAGFSVVGYTGTGSAATLGHGLGVKPQLIIVKSRSQARDWLVYHTSYGATQYTTLNGTGAAAATSSAWNNTEPTSTVFTIGNAAEINTNGSTNIAYCFSPVVGYSSFGSYTGNGSTDGPFVYTGMRPRWILLKASSTTGAWILHDTARTTYNVMGNELRPDDATAEYAVDRFDLLSNGFKVRSSNATLNTSSATYIYAAFAEAPFNYARAR
jgi:hypothetical protein